MDKRLVLLYAAIGVLLIVQAFTQPFVDYPVELMDNFLLSTGLTPYVDFFEHHPLFHNFLLAPVFWLGSPASAFVLYHFLGLAGVALCAWLVYRIARKNEFQNPHIASIFFLVGYTGLIIPFLRYEFWSMLFLLTFFAFKHPFVRGLSIAFLGATSPIVLLSAAVLAAVYYITTFLKNKKDAFIALSGSVTGVVFWLLLHRGIPFSTMYYYIGTFNSKIAHLYAVPWQEVTFFTFFFVIPLLALALLPMIRLARQKNELAVLGLTFSTVFLLQIITMNVAYGLFSRIKLPAVIPVMVIAIIFLATYRVKFAYVFVSAQVLLTLFAYTPSLMMPELDVAHTIGTLDRCVASDARIMVNEDQTTNINVPLFREPNTYYWFLRHFHDDAGITYTLPEFDEPLSICSNTIEQRDWTCTDAELTALKTECSALLVPNSAWLETRALLTGRTIATR